MDLTCVKKHSKINVVGDVCNDPLLFKLNCGRYYFHFNAVNSRCKVNAAACANRRHCNLSVSLIESHEVVELGHFDELCNFVLDFNYRVDL